MKPINPILGVIAFQFAALSLLAFGGANTVIPEMHRLAVERRHWMSDTDFVALFALSQAAPGPNFLISTLVGWKVAGLAGALVATLAMCGPTCLLAYLLAKVWERYKHTRWRKAFAAGLSPVAVGMGAATFWLLARAADTGVILIAVAGVSAIAVLFTRLNPVVILVLAAVLGVIGTL